MWFQTLELGLWCLFVVGLLCKSISVRRGQPSKSQTTDHWVAINCASFSTTHQQVRSYYYYRHRVSFRWWCNRNVRTNKFTVHFPSPTKYWHAWPAKLTGYYYLQCTVNCPPFLSTPSLVQPLDHLWDCRNKTCFTLSTITSIKACVACVLWFLCAPHRYHFTNPVSAFKAHPLCYHGLGECWSKLLLLLT